MFIGFIAHWKTRIWSILYWRLETFDPCVQLNKNQPVTVHDVLQILRLYVSVPQCDVFGYLSINHELVVLIAPVDQQPTPLQVKHTHTHKHSRLGRVAFALHDRACFCFFLLHCCEHHLEPTEVCDSFLWIHGNLCSLQEVLTLNFFNINKNQSM